MKKLIAVAVLSVVALSGCASAGNTLLAKETRSDVSSKIVVGHTTTVDVQNMYGIPSKSFDMGNGVHVWHYEYAHMKANFVTYIPVVGLFAGGANGYERDLDIYFKGDKVDKFEFKNRNAHYSNHGGTTYTSSSPVN